MPTECSADRFEFARVEGRAVVAAFDGGDDHLGCRGAAAGRHRPGDRAGPAVRRCFVDQRSADQVEHSMATLVGQRVFALALGYEDLIDHDTLRHDPVLAAVVGKLSARRVRLCAVGRQVDAQPTRARAGRGADALSQDRPRRRRDRAAVRRACSSTRIARRPSEIVLDLDATDDPLHGASGGPVLPRLLRLLLLPAALRLLRRPPAGGQAATVEHRRHRRGGRGGRADRRPDPRPLAARCGSSCAPIRGFAREALMAWCEANRVDYVFGLARNARLVGEIAAELALAKDEAEQTGKSARRFKDFRYQTLDSWSRARRVVGKAEHGTAAAGQRQPALRRHLAQRRGLGGAAALRAALLRPRRDGEPDVWTPPALQVCSSAFGHDEVSCGNVFGLAAATWPRASMRSAAGSRLSSRARSSLVLSGSADPGPTGHAIVSKITLAARGNCGRCSEVSPERVDPRGRRSCPFDATSIMPAHDRSRRG